MTKVAWDQVGQRLYETGVDHGVLYMPDAGGVYNDGVAWNGLVAVTESPSGAEITPQYADNMKYVSLVSAEEFAATIEAFTYPPEFGQFDGTLSPEVGIFVGQQDRRSFGLSYRTLVGNDLEGTAHGYKLHLLYGCLAAPSEKNYGTVNDSPEAITFSWEVSTNPVEVGEIGGVQYKPTASLVIDSTLVDATALGELEDLLYGTVGTDPSLPTPSDVIALFAGTVTLATPTEPGYNTSTHVITIPAVTGVIYSMDGVDLTAGVQPAITVDKVVEARPAPGYQFPDVTDTDWFFDAQSV
jgi:hypothetical protein